MNENRTIIITGSSGFIGSHLVSHFSRIGFSVRAFQRKARYFDNPLISCFRFELGDIKDEGFKGADYLVHCAYQSVLGKNFGSNVNMEGTKKIVSICRKYGIKIIFLSTMSAHSRAESNYGRQKLFMEGLFDPEKDLVLKPGLVLGAEGGLFGRIVSILKNKKIVPLVGGGIQFIQTIALDDLHRIIEFGIKKDIRGKFMVANNEKITMKRLYEKIAEKVGSKPLFIPVPISLSYFIARLFEIIGIQLPVTSENILGLKKLETFDTIPDLNRLGVDWPLKNCLSAINELGPY